MLPDLDDFVETALLPMVDVSNSRSTACPLAEGLEALSPNPRSPEGERDLDLAFFRLVKDLLSRIIDGSSVGVTGTRTKAAPVHLLSSCNLSIYILFQSNCSGNFCFGWHIFVATRRRDVVREFVVEEGRIRDSEEDPDPSCDLVFSFQRCRFRS